MARDEYLENAERELEEAVSEWNETGTVPEPGDRFVLAQVYALTSIARALHRFADLYNAPPADAED